MIRRTVLAPWVFEHPVPGSRSSPGSPFNLAQGREVHHAQACQALIASVLAGYEGREFFIDNLLVRINFIVMIRRTGLAPWEFEFSLKGGSLNLKL